MSNRTQNTQLLSSEVESHLRKKKTPGTPAQLFRPRHNKNLPEKIGYAIEQTCTQNREEVDNHMGTTANGE